MANEGNDQGLTGAPNAGSPSPEGQQPAATDQQIPGQVPNAPRAGDPPAGDRAQAGVLRDLQNERRARQEREARIQALETQLAQAEKRTRALAGIEPRSQEDNDAEEVRAKFAQLFPGLAKLNDAQMLEKLESLLQSADVHADTTKRYWADRAQQMTQGVVDKVAKEFGGQLTDRQVKQIRSAYAAAAEADPEFLARHEQGDPKLIEEFAAQWVEDWAGPARRMAVTDAVGRQRPVPGSRDRSITGSAGKKPVDFKNPKETEDAMVAAFRAHGGSFGND